ncbi:MAG: Dabb family protein [Deltaproteobacteria bacterium]|nr:Dabb family protein [Deltaproteobacteria bacterium]
MLKHVVFMKFKKGVAETEIQELEKGLAGLPAKISEIRGYEFGRDVLHTERSYDFALVSTFDDLDSMKRYQVHPEHQKVVERVRQLSENILAVDFNF